MLRRNRHILSPNIVIPIALLLGVVYAQAEFEPVPKFGRPPLEVAQGASFQFDLSIAVSGIHTFDEPLGTAVIGVVDPVMMITSGRSTKSTRSLPSQLLLEKWDYLDSLEVQLTINFEESRFPLLTDVHPLRLNGSSHFAFGVEASPQELVSIVGKRPTLTVLVESNGCTLGDSVPKCRFGDFSNQDLRGTDWTQSDLRFSIFDNANLEGARFSKSDVSGSSFHGAKLQDADFEGAFTEGVTWK